MPFTRAITPRRAEVARDDASCDPASTACSPRRRPRAPRSTLLSGSGKVSRFSRSVAPASGRERQPRRLVRLEVARRARCRVHPTSSATRSSAHSCEVCSASRTSSAVSGCRGRTRLLDAASLRRRCAPRGPCHLARTARLPLAVHLRTRALAGPLARRRPGTPLAGDVLARGLFARGPSRICCVCDHNASAVSADLRASPQRKSSDRRAQAAVSRPRLPACTIDYLTPRVGRLDPAGVHDLGRDFFLGDASSPHVRPTAVPSMIVFRCACQPTRSSAARV